MQIDGTPIGPGHPVYVIGEIGINHSASPVDFMRLASVAKAAGCDAVKSQVRTPEWCVPDEQKGVMRDTPWGVMTYLEYKQRMEFSHEQWKVLTASCGALGITLFNSIWDAPALRDTGRHHWPAIKVASASLTNLALLRGFKDTGKPVILSTGMSTVDEIDAAVETLGTDNLAIMQSTSAYPAEHADINLRVMETLRSRYGVPVGYSGHERGLAPTVAAVAMGADLVERHITLDRSSWGSDQSASIEPVGLERLVRDIRTVEEAMGSPDKRLLDCELPAKGKLRG